LTAFTLPNFGLGFLTQLLTPVAGVCTPQQANLWSAIEVGHKNRLPRVLTIVLINVSFSYTDTELRLSRSKGFLRTNVTINLSK